MNFIISLMENPALIRSGGHNFPFSEFSSIIQESPFEVGAIRTAERC